MSDRQRAGRRGSTVTDPELDEQIVFLCSNLLSDLIPAESNIIQTEEDSWELARRGL
jgi:hypothetical protein